MKTKSAKAKGRRCSQEVADLLIDKLKLDPKDVIVVPSGVTGPDIILSAYAFGELPYAIECKNQERLRIFAAMTQTEGHAAKSKGAHPLLFFRRNRSRLYAALPADVLIGLFARLAEAPGLSTKPV